MRHSFVCEDGNIAFDRPEFMRKVFQVLASDRKPNRVWFLQSKAPRCFEQYLHLLPNNTYIVTTLETKRAEGYAEISKAPFPSQRYADFMDLQWDKKIVTVKPVLDFDLDTLRQWIVSINPRAVFIGYNSKPEKVSLPESEKKKMRQLIHNLEEKRVCVTKESVRWLTVILQTRW